MSLKIKVNETRHWSTMVRGYIAIHAAKRRITREDAAVIDSDIWLPRPMPYGAVVCISKLISCRRTEEVRSSISEREEHWGNYADGRYAWLTDPDNLIELSEPIPLRGRQGIFSWEVPEQYAKIIRERDENRSIQIPA